MLKNLLSFLYNLDLPEEDSPGGGGSAALDTDKDKEPEAKKLKDILSDEASKPFLDTVVLHEDEGTGKVSKVKMSDLIDRGYKFGTAADRTLEAGSILTKFAKDPSAGVPPALMQKLDALVIALGGLSPKAKADAEDDIDKIMTDEDMELGEKVKLLAKINKDLKTSVAKEIANLRQGVNQGQTNAEMKRYVKDRSAELNEDEESVLSVTRTNYGSISDEGWKLIRMQRGVAIQQAIALADDDMARENFLPASVEQLREIQNRYIEKYAPSYEALAEKLILVIEDSRKLELEKRKAGGLSGSAGPTGHKTPQPPKGSMTDDAVVDFLKKRFAEKETG